MRFSTLRLCLGFSALVTFAAGCGDSGGSSSCSPSGAPITHTADILADETWASGIHVVPATIRVRSGARLTIAACTQVQLGASASIVVDKTAAGLSAQGTASDPITFLPQAGSPWGAVQVAAPATAVLSYTTLQGGGGAAPHSAATFEGASLIAQGDTTTPPVVLTADHLTVTGSTGLGVFLQGARFADSSSQLVITSSGYYPVYGGVASAASLPSGTYTGNAIDQILLQRVSAATLDDAGPLLVDATLHNRGVPYRVGTTPTSISVGSGRPTDPGELLTIEAGVTMLFTPQGLGGRSQLIVKGINDGGSGLPQGALLVAGTLATPVTFDSAADAPAAGDWQGLYFSAFVDPRTVVSGAIIADAGGNSGSVGVCEAAPGTGMAEASCAVDIFTLSPPTPFLQMSIIRNSALCGIYRGWSVDEVDFSGANQFNGVPGCIQTNIPDIHNACPPVACQTGT
ncbi:MAG: hypothetical protein ACXVCV_01955 [Polyangia bacterium]